VAKLIFCEGVGERKRKRKEGKYGDFGTIPYFSPSKQTSRKQAPVIFRDGAVRFGSVKWKKPRFGGETEPSRFFFSRNRRRRKYKLRKRKGKGAQLG